VSGIFLEVRGWRGEKHKFPHMLEVSWSQTGIPKGLKKLVIPQGRRCSQFWNISEDMGVEHFGTLFTSI